MADQQVASIIDPMRNFSFDSPTLLTTSTINGLHFPNLTTSGISDSGNGPSSRRTSILLDGMGMFDSMTESFSSAVGTDEIDSMNKIERKDSNVVQKKRRSRKSQFDASVESPALEKIETVNLIDDQNEADDVWLYRPPSQTMKSDLFTDNIISWVHQEFQSNDINASKHRLLCKLDDMSHARTIRSVSCHNFLDSQRTENFKRSSTEQQVHSEPLRAGRLSSPLRATIPLFPDQSNLPSTLLNSPVSLTHSMPTSNGSINYSTSSSSDVGLERSRSKEQDKSAMDFTDIEIMAKVQMENLRQAERQVPLSKRFGGSSVSLTSNSNNGTSVSMTNRSGNKPPVAPKPTVTTTTATKNALRSNPQGPFARTLPEKSALTPSQSTTSLSSRTSLLPPNSVNNNRTRPPMAAPLPAYRGSQTTVTGTGRLSTAPSSVPRNGKKFSEDLTNDNGLLNDVSNKPLTSTARSHVLSQRRSMMPTAETNSISTLTRSSSSLGQGRKSNIPTVGTKPQRTSTATVTRSSQSGPLQPSSLSIPSSSRAEMRLSWNDGCY